MIVPYEQTTIQDMTVGVKASTPRPSLNVAAIINSNTGPITRQSNANQNDLINKYLTGNAISANDNETIQCLGALLTSVAVDTIRVNNSPLRVGVGSMGSVLYFDDNFNLVKDITSANITENDSEPEVFYLTLSVDGANVCYYLGDETKIPTIPGTKVKLGTPTTRVTLSNFFQYLQGAGVCLGYNTTSSTLDGVLAKSGEDYLISKEIYDLIVDDQNGNINSYAFSDVITLSPGDFLKIGNITYVNMGTGAPIGVVLSSYENPVELVFDTDSPTAAKFLAAVLNNIFLNKNTQLPWGCSLSVTMDLSAATSADGSKIPTAVTIMGDIAPYITYNAAMKTITCTNGITQCTGGRIVITNTDGTTESYYFGDLSPTAIDVFIGKVGCVQDFLIGIYNYKAVSELNQLGITTRYSGSPNGSALLMYKSASGPTITRGTSSSSAIIITQNAESDYKELFHLTDEDNKGSKSYDSQYICIGSICFYAGDKPIGLPSTINTYSLVSTLEMSTSEFITAAYRAAYNEYALAVTPTGIILNGSYAISASSNILVTNSKTVDQFNTTDKFAVVTRFPSTLDLFNFSYTFNNDEYGTFTINYKFKNINDTITISFDGSAVNGYGKSLFFENYNEGDFANDYIYIAELTGSDHLNSYQSNAFGSQILCLPPTEADYAEAMLKFKGYKDKSYQFIWDSGHSHPTLAKAMVQVSNKFHAQVIPSYPTQIKSVADATAYYEGLGLNDCEVVHLVPAHRNTYNGDFLSVVPASVSYIMARVNAFNTSSQEFIPLFGSVKGICSAPNLVWNIKDDDDPTKSEQQLLLNNNINSVIKELGKTYINANATGQSVTSYLSEDQNVYMTNILSQICDQYNPSITAELNDEGLWSKVISDLGDNINQRMIAGKKPRMNAFKVICDEYLNPQSVVEARELVYEVWVQYTPSVAYVKAYVQVVRLNTI